MKQEEIFAAALELGSPWEVSEIKFMEHPTDSMGKGELHITISYPKGSKFNYEGEFYSVYDHQPRVWRHLNFFQHECYLHARVPRVKTREGKVKLVDVPWAGDNTSFTLLFERMLLELIEGGMNCSSAGSFLGLDNKRVFRIIKRQVNEVLFSEPVGSVTHIGIDETSSKKGHEYLTIVTDRVQQKVVGIGIGRDAESVNEAFQEIEIREGNLAKIKTATMDMWRAYILGVSTHLSKANIIFDRFHLASNLNKKIDAIRKAEQKEFAELKGTKYAWLKNGENLTEEVRKTIKILSNKYKKLGEAYRLKELFREVMDYASVENRLYWLNSWMKEAWNSGIKQMQEFVRMLKEHWYGIKNYFTYRATNAFAERVNLKIQEIKRVAKGYRNLENYKTMIYLQLGGLNFKTHYK